MWNPCQAQPSGPSGGSSTANLTGSGSSGSVADDVSTIVNSPGLAGLFGYPATVAAGTGVTASTPMSNLIAQFPNLEQVKEKITSFFDCQKNRCDFMLAALILLGILLIIAGRKKG